MVLTTADGTVVASLELTVAGAAALPATGPSGDVLGFSLVAMLMFAFGVIIVAPVDVGSDGTPGHPIAAVPIGEIAGMGLLAAQPATSKGADARPEGASSVRRLSAAWAAVCRVAG